MLLLLAILSWENPRAVDLGDFELYNEYISFAVSPDGVVCLISHMDAQVIFLNKDLELIHRKHDQGEGPGELKMPRSVFWDPDAKNFGVFDLANSRIYRFDPSGKLLSEKNRSARTFTMLPGKNGSFYYPMQFVDKKYRSELYHITPGKTTEEDVKKVVHTIDLVGSRKMTHAMAGNRKISFVLDWDALLYAARGSDFLACNRGDGVEVVILDLDGKPRGGFTTDLPKRPVVDQHLEDHMLTLPKMHHQRIRQAVELPDYWPVIRDLMVDEQDRVVVIGSPTFVGKPVPYRIHHVDGKLVKKGELSGPPVGIAGNRFYLIETNDEGDRFLKIHPID
ncbi:MAG: hypothetical protein QNK37_06295 [Acidobacteriota bacterium]|nr:hypothetical protein [Acidobacteriota bacterium]